MASTANVTELPVSNAHWEEQIRQAHTRGFMEGFSEGTRETKADHVTNLQRIDEVRLRVHRRWTYVGILLVVVASVWVSITEYEILRNVFWICVGAAGCLTAVHWLKWGYYDRLLKRYR